VILILLMSLASLHGVNLNLLAAFDALMAERNVTRAARRAGVTQSAMSNSLAQLRALFEDPLFRRVAHGIEPTPRALELGARVHEGLALLGRALAPPAFDPEASQRTFVLAASDQAELVVLPGLLRRLSRDAPGVRVEVRPWGLHEVPDLLARGEADLMIGFYDRVPPRHRHQLLFDDEYVCLARRGHPRIGKRLTLKVWLELPHVLVSQRPGSPGTVDVVLARRSLRRTVGARVSHFLLVPPLVARTDMVAALSARIADIFAEPFGLRRFPPPVALPKGRMGQAWHEQMDADPGHLWLRRQIAEVCA
jgi:DNA-binding transcriptional LysR family regulator